MAAASLRAWPMCALVIGLWFVSGSSADAQHFGRNKVKYRTFDFRVLKTEHFDIYFYTKERAAIDIVARLAERWNDRLERLSGHTLFGRQPLILYSSHADFEQTNVIDGELGDGTAGVTEPFRRRIVLPMGGSIGELDHVLGHELFHAFQFDIVSSVAGDGEMLLGRLPLWFVEGMAEYASLGAVNSAAALRIRDAVRLQRLPSIADLNRPDYFPYHWGHAVFAHLAGRHGNGVISRLLITAATTGDVAAAFTTVLGVSLEDVSRDWHAALQTLYGPAIASAAPLEHARRVVAGQTLGADFNIGPSLSPDGRSLAFLSSRGVFSIDVYIADVETGRIRRRLTRNSTDSRYSSIQFIHSAGSWHPSGERIAVATVVAGRAALTIFNATNGKRDRDVVLQGIDEILNPSWSPDGQAIAITGLRDGLTDLFVYDIPTGRLNQITSDPYADVHPTWSPDGTQIAFATDRFSSDVVDLQFGTYRLAIVDVKTGVIAPVQAFSEGQQINPQWSSNGRALFFIGDPDGVPNVYRMQLSDSRIEQITRLATGVAGVTHTSPALSLSSGSGTLAMTVFDHDRYDMYVQSAEAPGMSPVPTSSTNAALTPYRPPDQPEMAGDSPSESSSGEPYSIVPYRSKLSLDGFGQPTAGVGAGRFGSTVGGGMAVYFSDMLRDHLVAAAVQIESVLVDEFSLNDIAFEAGYYNLKGRWNWGIVAAQIPYFSSVLDSTATTVSDPAAVDIPLVYRQTQRTVSGVVSYPFNRAKRVEFHGGIAHTAFDQMSNPIGFWGLTSDSAVEGRPVASQTLATSTVALVFDSASVGPTSPVLGQRYRFEVSPTFGSMNFTGVLIDYRKYAMPVPFYTIAARLLHYGRYGRDSDDARQYPVYINHPSLVRGYDDPGYALDCRDIAQEDCDRNASLVGSRMLVGNLELRFPILRPFGVSSNMYGPAAMELAIFGDAGVAWTARDKPTLIGGSRTGVGSAGVAVRLGLGVAVAEFNVTRPFQRPDDSWVWGFNLFPGW